MTSVENGTDAPASVEEMQRGWHDLSLRVGQLETERSALEGENRALRFLLERVIEHRQKSHGELVLLLTDLVSKLPSNDVGLMVSKLVEHNKNVSEVCAVLAKGNAGADLPQPAVLRMLDQTKRDLRAAVKPAVEELIQLDPPLDNTMLRSLIEKPELFFSPAVVRANRCFVKGQVPRERVVSEFGPEVLVFFNDMTTDPKLNPAPKPEEIVLGFKIDFPALFQQNPALTPDKREGLQALHQRIQRSRLTTEQGRAQKIAFQKLSFILELLHYYENQGTEAPDLIFAQRLPALIEQLVVTGPEDNLEEKTIIKAEGLLAFVINPDHRLMVVNNMEKGGAAGRTLKYVLRLRAEKAPDQHEVIAKFIRHLVPLPPQTPPPPQALAATLRLIKPDVQALVVRAIMSLERLRREEAEALGRTIAKELGLSRIEEEAKAPAPVAVPPEMERQMAWETIKELITKRSDPATIATAIRERLHARYDDAEVKQSWLTLIQADAMTLIRTFCQLPYLPDGRTDSIARAVMETYVSRLTHEKYAATYTKIANSLRSMHNAKPDSPTLLNFLALVRWVDPEASNKLSMEIGMAAA